MDNKELLIAHLYSTAVFPVIKILLEEDPDVKKSFENVKATVVIRAKHDGGYKGSSMYFDHGNYRVEETVDNNPDIQLTFGSVDKMNTFLKGGLALPAIKGFGKPVLLFKVIKLLLRLKLMMPDNNPKKPLDRYLKVKMAFYMVTTALSKYNKWGNPDMQKWTKSQPDRIYQISVDDNDIAAYLRIKGGKTKAGRGFYERKRPFIHMQFGSVDGALAVLLKEAEFVKAVDQGFVTIHGSPEYAANLNDFMMHIQTLTT